MKSGTSLRRGPNTSVPPAEIGELHGCWEIVERLPSDSYGRAVRARCVRCGLLKRHNLAHLRAEHYETHRGCGAPVPQEVPSPLQTMADILRKYGY
jgi:hypothetical protein